MKKIVQTAGRTQLGEFAPEFAHLNDDILFGEVWSRNDLLSLRDRSLVTITSLISQGITDSSLKYHLQSAKNNGITRTEAAEIITHITFYAGWPKAWAAFNLAKEVWSEDVKGDDAKAAFQCDENLLKYKNLVKDTTEKVTLSSKEDLKESEVNINFNRIVNTDPDSITPGQFLFLEGEKEIEATDKILKGLSRVKEFLGDSNARKFNISISEKLLKILKENNSLISGRIRNQIFVNNNDDSVKYVNTNMNSSGNKKEKKGFLEKLFGKRKKTITEDKIEEPKKLYEINVIELFDQVKILAGKEKEFKERTEAYMSLIHKATVLNQQAQLEKLISELVIHIYESVLAVSGINHYITMSDLVTLQKKCEKQLDIDYIKNFTRVIPDSVAEKKVLADNLQVFDNYVILYYDPTGKSFSLTEYEKAEEERIKKDPILFGVIKDSDKLYYIDSWIDDLCDLTWDQVVEKLSEDKTL